MKQKILKKTFTHLVTTKLITPELNMQLAIVEKNPMKLN